MGHKSSDSTNVVRIAEQRYIPTKHPFVETAITAFEMSYQGEDVVDEFHHCTVQTAGRKTSTTQGSQEKTWMSYSRIPIRKEIAMFCTTCQIQWEGRQKRCVECGQEFPRERPPRQQPTTRRPSAPFWCPTCEEGRFWARYVQSGSGVLKQKEPKHCHKCGAALVRHPGRS